MIELLSTHAFVVASFVLGAAVCVAVASLVCSGMLVFNILRDLLRPPFDDPHARDCGIRTRGLCDCGEQFR